MHECIEVSGYLAFFDVKESGPKYQLTRCLAKELIKKNVSTNIPLVISHIDYSVDLTIGRVSKLHIDNRGLYCVGIIDNVAFLEAQQKLSETFINYFTKAKSSPFLYMKSWFPCFSLAHHKNTLSIKHVALVDLGARRGTLIDYKIDQTCRPMKYNNKVEDFYILLVCYTRQALKFGNERKEKLLEDAILCKQSDIDFICASMDISGKKSIKDTNEHKSDQQPLTMNQDWNNDAFRNALSAIGNLASVFQNSSGQKRKLDDDSHSSTAKYLRTSEKPITNAVETLSSTETQPDVNALKTDLQQMQTEFKNTQKMFQDFMKQQNSQQNGFYPNYGFQPQLPPSMYQPYMYNSVNQPMQESYQPNGSNVQPGQSQVNHHTLPTTQHVVPPSTVAQCVKHQNDQNVQQTPIDSNIREDAGQNQPIEVNPSPPIPQSKATASNLIEAGLDIDEGESRVNELFKYFLENTFVVKKKY